MIGDKQADEESLEARRKRIQKQRAARRAAEEEGLSLSEVTKNEEDGSFKAAPKPKKKKAPKKKKQSQVDPFEL